MRFARKIRDGQTDTHPLRAWREKAGLTGTALAEKIGVKKSTLSGYENGTRIPRKRTLIKIKEVTAGFITADDFMHEAAE